MATGTADHIRQKVGEILERHRERMLADTTRIINFETVSGGNPEQEKKYREQIPACLAWLRELAAAMGFRFHVWEGRVAEIEWAPEGGNNDDRQRPVFGIAAHIDVVTPVGKWTHPPFSGTISNGILYGRGIQDDKGPLIQALYGMYAVKEAGIKPPCDVRIIIGTSEETGDWSDVQLYLEKRGAPDYCFTPDADFPIITGEKGMLNLRFRATWDKVLPDEDTQMEFVLLKGGERSNIVPGLAEATLRFPAAKKNDVMKEMVRETTRFTVENPGSNVTLVPGDERSARPDGSYESLISFIGKPVHSSLPAKGHNAAVDALRFFSDIETLPRAVRAYIQFLAFIGSTDDGTNLRIDSTHPFVGDTTTVLSLLHIDQIGGEATVNIRPTMGLSCSQVITRARAAARAWEDSSGLRIDVVDGNRCVEAIFLDRASPAIDAFISSLQLAYETVTGETAEECAIGGTTYAKAFPNCCAFGPIKIGVDEELAHQTDEHMAVDSIFRNALIYGLAIAFMGRTDDSR